MSIYKVGAIVLAGAPPSPEMDPDGKLKSRAMVKINGKTMLQYIVDALRGSETVSSVVAIGCVEADGLDKVLEPVGNIVDNINCAVEELFGNKDSSLEVPNDSNVGGVDSVLVVCADIPLLTPQAVDDFVKRAIDLQVDFVYPIVNKSACQGEYANMKRTYVKTGDGCFTGGNITLVKSDFYANHADAIARAFAVRKKPVALAGLIGYGILLRFLVGQIFPSVLRVSMLEESVGRMLGAKLKALVTNYAEIGEDVDKVEDVKAMCSILDRRATSLDN